MDCQVQRDIIASFENGNMTAKKDKGELTGDPVTYQTPSPAGGVQMETFIP